MDSQITKKKDFVEIKYTGYANGEAFDSNIEEDLKKISDKSKPIKTIVAIGEGMVVRGLDKELEGKDIGKEYKVDIAVKDSFGERKRELIKTIPLKSFIEKKVNPRPGMVLALDNYLVKIIAVSGARVITDFNNPLAGKNISYKFTITRKVEDDREKAEAIFSSVFKFVPEFEVRDKIIVRGPRALEAFVKEASKGFREIMGKELDFEEKKEIKEKEIKENKNKGN